ncbi:MAG: hypothetical protein M0Z40_10425 [Actinomycetota bacterium]|nr:hypothetical protein [Actinomycetota bacterium]
MSWTHASRRHGIARHAAGFVVEDCGLVYIQPAPPDSAVPDPRVVFLGDDEAGRAIEEIGIEMEVDANGEGHLRVIHATALRDKYRGQYEEAKRWRV